MIYYKMSFDANSHITDISAIIDAPNNTIEIGFTNLNFGELIAVKFTATGYNIFGDVVPVNGDSCFSILFQDLLVAKNGSVSGLKYPLPNNEIRKIKIVENQVCYSDGTILHYDCENPIEWSASVYDDLNTALGKARKDHFGIDFKYVPVDLDSGWVCGCGRYNSSVQNECSNCGCRKDDVLKLLDDAFNDKLLKDYRKKQQAIQNEAEVKKKSQKRALKKKAILYSLVCLVLLIGLSLISYKAILSQRRTFQSAAGMQDLMFGTYSLFNSKSQLEKRIVLNNKDHYTLILYFPSLGDDVSNEFEVPIKKWNYRIGKIDDIIALADGSIKRDGEVYIRGTKPKTSSTYASSTPKPTSTPKPIETAESALHFDFDKKYSSGYYTYYGTVTNNGKYNYKYVKVRITYTDTFDKVVDTDWTYAVGSEGLRPGESTKFDWMHKNDSHVAHVNVEISDYDQY